jgi:F420-non-reducing hydrogenase iron-sulfur subunit
MHCAYAAADLAGSSRIAYPTSLKIVALPCTGRTDMGHILKTFEDGADGVLVAGCLEGRCHFQTGNLYARQRVDHVAELLDQIGLQKDRVRMINVSAGQGARFAELANEFAGTIKTLGPTGLKKKTAPKEFPLPKLAKDEQALPLADPPPASKDSV